MKSELRALNAALRKAAEFAIGCAEAKPLLVIAGAGSGKTSTLAHRVAHLVAAGADPQRLLLLTFSRRAAVELERRAGRALAVLRSGRHAEMPTVLPWAGTFHGIGARLLREYAARVGLAANFTIHDRGDSEDLMGLVRNADAAVAATERRFPAAATCVAIYSRAVNSEAALGDVLRDDYPWCAHCEDALRAIFAAYVDAKQTQQILDFDDLLLYWAAMMEEPALAAEVGSRFDHVLVDEYQDTNRLQASILHRLKPDGRGVTVVGDDAQAIYGFRAATVRNILEFPARYAPAATVITLDRNYRSTQGILDAANAVMAEASERYAKDLATDRGAGEKARLVTLADEAAQAQFVATEVLRHRENGIDLKDQAVLFRTSSHSAQLELELARRHIPFVKFGGLRFLDAAHVKDVLSILRWVDNPRGRLAGFRALRLLPGVGPATAVRWLDALERAGEPIVALQAFAVPAAAETGWEALVALYRDLGSAKSAWPAEMDSVLDWYRPQLERIHDDAPLRAADLVQLRRIAATYPSRERFLTELALDPPAAAASDAGPPHLDEEYLTLSTIHSAKGLEWKSVAILNGVDGCIPSDMATGKAESIAEERRLLYVAMTRAKDHLAIVLPHRFYVRQQSGVGDRHVYAVRSRFLTEAVCERFDEESWPPAATAVALGRPAAGTKVDLAARMRLAWSRGSQ